MGNRSSTAYLMYRCVLNVYCVVLYNDTIHTIIHTNGNYGTVFIVYYCLDQKKLGIQFYYHNRSTKNTINSAQPLQLNSTTYGRAGGLNKGRIIHSNACRQ